MSYHIIVTGPLPYSMLASSSSTILPTLQGSTVELVGGGDDETWGQVLVTTNGPVSATNVLSQGSLVNNGVLYPIGGILLPFPLAMPTSAPTTTFAPTLGPTLTMQPTFSPAPSTRRPVIVVESPGQYPVCYICRAEGRLPSNPDVVPDPPLAQPSPLTCQEFYEFGVTNRIPAALCFPLQTFLEEPCGC